MDLDWFSFGGLVQCQTCAERWPEIGKGAGAQEAPGRLTSGDVSLSAAIKIYITLLGGKRRKPVKDICTPAGVRSTGLVKT